MKKYSRMIFILYLIVIAIIPRSNLVIKDDLAMNGELIERDETPKDLDLNVLEIYNYKNEPLIFFDGYHQKGVIYLGDFEDIEGLYNYAKLDFILISKNTGNQREDYNFYYIPNLKNVELQDDDNSIAVIDENTIVLELKRFKFIISNNLSINSWLEQIDAQFFIINNEENIDIIQERFSVEHIFYLGETLEEQNPLISMIQDKYFIQFICNHSSYKFQYKQYK